MEGVLILLLLLAAGAIPVYVRYRRTKERWRGEWKILKRTYADGSVEYVAAQWLGHGYYKDKVFKSCADAEAHINQRYVEKEEELEGCCDDP